MASWVAPPSHATGDDFSVTDYTALAGDVTFLYQRPYAAYYNSVGTTLSNSTATQITLGGTTASGYGFSVSSNNIIVPLTGIYQVSFAISYSMFGQSATVGAESYAYHNGSQVIQGGVATASTNLNAVSAGAGLISCSANDTIALWGFQIQGGSIGTVTGASNTFMHVFFVGSQ